MSLCPTPSRLRLLAKVAGGRVILAGIPGSGVRRRVGAVLLDEAGAFVRDVTAEVDELERATWVERPDRTATYRPTDVGRAVLAEAVLCA